MNLKTFISVTFCVLFLLPATAQIFTHDNADELKLKITVDDVQNGNAIEQEYTIAAKTAQKTVKNVPVKLKLMLDYKSAIDTITFFRIEFEEDIIVNALSTPLNNGTTVPVIIPPIRKDSTRFSLRNFSNPNLACNQRKSYPYTVETNITPSEDSHSMTVKLYRYNSRDEYCSGVYGTLESTVTFTFTTFSEIPVNLQNRADYILHPNPSSDYVTIQETTGSVPHKNPGQKSSVLIIYNMKGMEVSRHNLSGQPISTRHLPKGVYYCHIKNGNHTTVKTLIKN